MQKSITTEWPTGVLDDLSARSARERAATVRRAFLGAQHFAPLTDLSRLATTAGFEVRVTPLGGALGSTEGLLIPCSRGGFRISVDPTPHGGWKDTPSALRRVIERHRVRFRIAHELGHSFFYDTRNARPVRETTPGRPSEEQFCDEFARALLVPPRVVRRLPLNAASVLMLHRTYDVSIELAARAFAAFHPRASAVGVFRGSSDQPDECQWGAFRGDLSESRMKAAAARAVFPRAQARSNDDGISTRVLRERRQVVVVGTEE